MISIGGTSANKITEKRLKLYGHVKRRDEGHVLRKTLDVREPGTRRRGRQKIRWKDSCKRDMESLGLKEEDALDRTKWKNDIQYHSGDPRGWKMPEEKKIKKVHIPWQYMPPVQFTQSLSALLCVVLEKVPAGQLMGTPVPNGQYWPIGQTCWSGELLVWLQ